jgi:hypothetical protein
MSIDRSRLAMLQDDAYVIYLCAMYIRKISYKHREGIALLA